MTEAAVSQRRFLYRTESLISFIIFDMELIGTQFHFTPRFHRIKLTNLRPYYCCEIRPF